MLGFFANDFNKDGGILISPSMNPVYELYSLIGNIHDRFTYKDCFISMEFIIIRQESISLWLCIELLKSCCKETIHKSIYKFRNNLMQSYRKSPLHRDAQSGKNNFEKC